MSASSKVRNVARVCEEHLHDIAELFKPGAKITLLVRRPGEPDQDFMLTIDDLDEVSAMLERSKTREEEIA